MTRPAGDDGLDAAADEAGEQEGHRDGARHPALVVPGRRFNRTKCWLEFWLEKPLEFWLDILYT